MRYLYNKAICLEILSNVLQEKIQQWIHLAVKKSLAMFSRIDAIYN